MRINFLWIVMFCSTLLILGGCGYAEKNSPTNNSLKEEMVILNVGQHKFVKIPVRNDTNKPWVIKKVGVCCGNPKPTINMETIPAYTTAFLTQKVIKKKIGKFKITDRVYLAGTEKPLVFEIKGEVKQPISASIGWVDGEMQDVDYSLNSLRLEKVKHEGKKLVIQLASEKSLFDLNQNPLKSLESKYFSLDYSHPLAPVAIKEKNMSVLCLSSNFILPPGELRDEISITFEDGTCCYIPFEFRCIADVYGECSTLNLGRLTSAKIIKQYKLFFSENVERWKNVNWKVEGKLSEAITVLQESRQVIGNGYSLTIEIDPMRLSPEIKGFVSSELIFSGDNNDDNDAVRLLTYGYL